MADRKFTKFPYEDYGDFIHAREILWYELMISDSVKVASKISRDFPRDFHVPTSSILFSEGFSLSTRNLKLFRSRSHIIEQLNYKE